MDQTCNIFYVEPHPGYTEKKQKAHIHRCKGILPNFELTPDIATGSRAQRTAALASCQLPAQGWQHRLLLLLTKILNWFKAVFPGPRQNFAAQIRKAKVRDCCRGQLQTTWALHGKKAVAQFCCSCWVHTYVYVHIQKFCTFLLPKEQTDGPPNLQTLSCPSDAASPLILNKDPLDHSSPCCAPITFPTELL